MENILFLANHKQSDIKGNLDYIHRMIKSWNQNEIVSIYMEQDTVLLSTIRQNSSDLTIKNDENYFICVIGNVEPLHTPENLTITLTVDKKIPLELLSSDISRVRNAAKNLTGSFLIYILDKKHYRSLFISDRSASRPIYYRESNDFTAVSSDIRSLFVFLGYKPQINPANFAEFVRIQTILGNKTLYNGILTLEPGSILAVNLKSGRKNFYSYWKMMPLTPYETENLAINKLAITFQNAAQRITRGTTKGGVLFSGGMDSRLILMLIAEQGISAKAVTFGLEENTETKIAKEIANRLDVFWEFSPQSANDYWANISKLLPAIQAQYSLLHSHPNKTAIKLGLDGIDTIFHGMELCVAFSGSYLPKEYFSLLGRSIYTYRLAKIVNIDSIPSLLLQELDIQSGNFLNSFLSDDLADEWHTSAVSSLSANVELAAQNWGNKYDIYEKSLIISGWSKFRSYLVASVNRLYAKERSLMMDSEVIDAYLRLPVEFRFLGPIYRRSMLLLNPEITKMSYPNVGTSPLAPPFIQGATMQIRQLIRANKQRINYLSNKLFHHKLFRIVKEGVYSNPNELVNSLGNSPNSIQKDIRESLLDGHLATMNFINRNRLQKAFLDSENLSDAQTTSILALITMELWLSKYST